MISSRSVFYLLTLTLACSSTGAEPKNPAATASDPARLRREFRDFAMGRDGDVARGRQLFEDRPRTACSQCHSTDGRGGKAGPDLYAIGDKFPRRDIIRAILEPSADIAIGYGTTVIETKSGEEHQGILKDATAEKLVLMLADGRSLSLNISEIQSQKGSQISLMPEGLETTMSRQEFSDLVEYLTSLRQPESALPSVRGMPSSIAPIARPIAIRPLIEENLRFPHQFVQKPGDVRSGLVWFGQIPGASNEFLVVHQTGKIWRLQKGAGAESKSLFADVSGELFNERGPNGLLGLAFHPKFRENRKYYLKHQVFEEGRIATVVVERQASADLRSDSGQTSRRLWKVVSSTQDHSGGCLGFGPDGYLYIAMGDTGPQQDPQGHGQDMTTHLGKLLRIDVDRTEDGRPYAIPADNPFRSQPGVLPEIWASGFREPWRFSFDRLTGDLWVGDVGQDRVEEVGIVRRGENHGWNVFEGFEPFSNRYRKTQTSYQPPVFAYRRKYGNSITGGFVYRGDPNSSFYGVYVCGDYTSRRIWGVSQENRLLKQVLELGVAPQGIASFAEDHAGNLYLVGYEGMIYQLDFTESKFEPATNSDSTRSAGVNWIRHSFPLPESIWSIEALDANGDGKKDLIAMGETKIFGLLAPNWQTNVLADTREPKMLYCVALDADHDGDLDLAVGRYRVPWIEYRQGLQEGKTVNPPSGPDFSIAWIENLRRADSPWPIHPIDREFNGIHGLCLGDVDGDGLADLIADSIMGPLFPKSLGWFRNHPSAGATFPRQLITSGGADGRPHYLDFADINGDGKGDLVAGDSGGGTFTWWQQGSGTPATWTKHIIAREPGATNVKAVDVNRDGQLDVVVSCGHGQGVFWFENPTWKKHVIDGGLRDAHALAVGDFNADGKVDVATASFGAKVVRWYRGNGEGEFERSDIDTTNQQEAYDLKAVDLDADGRLDLILAGRETRNAVWFRNQPSN
mgnify:CR=1 FL=1